MLTCFANYYKIIVSFILGNFGVTGVGLLAQGLWEITIYGYIDVYSSLQY